MANFAELISYIVDNIKSNDSRSITGNLLQDTLLQMVTQLGEGARFEGVATLSTDPGTPNGTVFYFAKMSGVYSYFDITLNGGLHILHNLNGSWSSYKLIDEQVQSDWNERDSSKKSFIINKPTVPSKTSDLDNDSNFLQSFVVTVEKTNNVYYSDKTFLAIYNACNSGKNVIVLYSHSIFILSNVNTDIVVFEHTDAETGLLQSFQFNSSGDIEYYSYDIVEYNYIVNKLESKEDKYVVDNSYSGSTINITIPQIIKNKYYNISGDVEELNIVLPERQEEVIETIKLYFSTASTQVNYSITCERHPVKFISGFDIDSMKTYELTITFNGLAWLVNIAEYVAS